MNDGPTPAHGASAMDIDRIPPDPAALITGLAQALAAVHLGEITDVVMSAGDEGDDGEPQRSFDHAAAAGAVAAAIHAGWTPPEGSPYERVGSATIGAVVAAGLIDVGERHGPDAAVMTIGDATLVNLVLPPRPLVAALSAASNLTFRRTRSTTTGSPCFRSWTGAALSDPYRDLSVAMADVVATFGPGAVLGFVEAYATANPGVEPMDPIRLDWWSMVTAVLGTALPASAQAVPTAADRPSRDLR